MSEGDRQIEKAMTHKASNINPNHIFVDTNVLVGGYSGDARFQKDADCLQLNIRA